MRVKRDVGRFIEQHGLDKRNAKKLKEASDDVAEKVMMNGIATTARNPSAYVQWAVQQETKKEQAANGADWDEEEGELGEEEDENDWQNQDAPYRDWEEGDDEDVDGHGGGEDEWRTVGASSVNAVALRGVNRFPAGTVSSE